MPCTTVRAAGRVNIRGRDGATVRVRVISTEMACAMICRGGICHAVRVMSTDQR